MYVEHLEYHGVSVSDNYRTQTLVEHSKHASDMPRDVSYSIYFVTTKIVNTSWTLHGHFEDKF